MTTRSETVSAISFIGEEFVQNMMRVVAYIREEVVVVIHVSSQLGWCGILSLLRNKHDILHGHYVKIERHPQNWNISHHQRRTGGLSHSYKQHAQKLFMFSHVVFELLK